MGGGGGGGGGTLSDPQALFASLQACVMEQHLQAFYPQPGQLQQIAQKVASSGALSKLAQEWRLPAEIAVDLCKLALYDTVILCDDSGSVSGFCWRLVLEDIPVGEIGH